MKTPPTKKIELKKLSFNLNVLKGILSSVQPSAVDFYTISLKYISDMFGTQQQSQTKESGEMHTKITKIGL